MKWNKYTLTTTAEAEDMISSMMMEAGIEGIEIEDKVPLSGIRTAPKMNMIIFSRLLLLLSKSTSPLCLDFEADMSISQEDELFY